MIRARLVVVAAVACLSGCSFAAHLGDGYTVPDGIEPEGDYPCAHPVAATTDAIVGGLLVVPASASLISNPNSEGGLVAFPMVIVGGVYAISAIHGFVGNRHCRSELDARAARAREISLRANEAANRDDCPTVAALDREACVLDEKFHATTFFKDPSLARCVLQSEGIAHCTAMRAQNEYDACVARRRQIYEQMQATDDITERQALLGQAPKCDAMVHR